MFLAVDVLYSDDDLTAAAAGVTFSAHTDQTPKDTFVRKIQNIKPYIPGEFYKRELPCILELLKRIPYRISTIIIDGYVDLGSKPGLGRHLYESLNAAAGVIGVAKSYFKGSSAIRVFRGSGQKPLFVTSAGIEQDAAVNIVKEMHGKNRIPSLLKLVDRLTREKSGSFF